MRCRRVWPNLRQGTAKVSRSGLLERLACVKTRYPRPLGNRRAVAEPHRLLDAIYFSFRAGPLGRGETRGSHTTVLRGMCVVSGLGESHPPCSPKLIPPMPISDDMFPIQPQPRWQNHAPITLS